MVRRKPSPPTAESIARSERQLSALKDGAKALAEIERDAVKVRENMRRLRALREARDSSEITTAPAEPATQKKRRARTP